MMVFLCIVTYFKFLNSNPVSCNDVLPAAHGVFILRPSGVEGFRGSVGLGGFVFLLLRGAQDE